MLDFQQNFLNLLATGFFLSLILGTIFFHYVSESDFKPQRYYTCTAENTKLRDYKFGSQFVLKVVTNKRRSLSESSGIPPSEQYVNQSSPIALLGQTHKLHCFFAAYPEPDPTWYHNGHEITQDNADGFMFESYGKTLTFNVTADKGGNYECRFPGHNDIDRHFVVTVESAPYWSVEGPPANTNTSEGETVNYNCLASGKPLPQVTFYKNGVEMKNDKSVGNVIIDGSQLTIYNVRKGINGLGDNAVYQCKVENKHGYLWANFYLNLLAFKPQLLEEPGEVEAVLGKPFTIECKFFASPIANVTWKNPSLLGKSYSQNVDQFGVGRLVIDKVEEDNEGQYECIGENKYGTATGLVSLLVRRPTVLAPVVNAKQVHQAGQPLHLPCKAEHDENLPITYRWFVGEKPINPAESDGYYRVSEDNTLIIDRPTQFDSSEYKCIASTKLDSSEIKIKVDVQDVPLPVHSPYIENCDPVINNAKITFNHLESANTAVPVNEFWIQYQIDPDVDQNNWKVHPIPVDARKNEVVVENERRVKGTISILLQPYGRYVFRIIARNAVGDSAPTLVKNTCETNAQAPLKNPSNVRVEGVTPDNLMVYWDPMQRDFWNGPKYGYIIKYRPKGSDGSWKTIEVDDPFVGEKAITLDKEEPYQPYEVAVQSRNEKGETQVTPQSVIGYTGEGDPGVTVTGFRVDNIGSSSADFRWDAVDPNAVNGNFKGYKITYWSEDEDEIGSGDDSGDRFRRSARSHTVKKRDVASGRKSVKFSKDATMGTITDLKPNTMNYAYITVENGQNEGQQSETISFRTKDGLPTAVAQLRAFPVNSKSPQEKGVVLLAWDQPRTPNGAITKYSVVKCVSYENDPVTTENRAQYCKDAETYPADTKSIRVTGLENEAPYRFHVHAHTSAGQGPPNSAEIRTLPQAMKYTLEPESPDLLRESIGEDHFNVTIIPGSYNDDDKRPVGNTFYIRYREVGEDEWQTKHLDESELTTTIGGLNPGTKHEVQVVSVQKGQDGKVTESTSRTHHITTTGESPMQSRLWWILLIILIILLLLIILCIICLCTRRRGQKYNVAERERQQGREPILPKDRTFEDYAKRDDDEKKSLTGHSRGDSETDSMAEYGDGDPGRFTEDGSFIGQYGAQSKGLINDKP
uniref:Neuroglian n=1 Tax=Panagrellus redivivus TaxID=6233 RepID=A0A7E4W950_PANRE